VTTQVEPLVTPRSSPRPRRPRRPRRLRRLRRLGRRRLGLVAGLLLAVGLVVVFVVQYRGARDRLSERRAQLEATQANLAGTLTELDRVGRRTELTQDGVDLVRSAIDLAVATRTWVEAVTRNTVLEIAAVEAAQENTAAALWTVAVNSNEAQACFGGVAQAVDANRGGDGQTAVDALRGAAGNCTSTLAYATGARFPYDFADPFVLRAGDRYYGYSTNSGAGDIQVIRSSDLVTWELVGNALAALPSWAAPDATWAPAVLERGGGYVAYYTVRDAASHRQCISRAVAATPVGPFHDDSAGPLVCQLEHGGSIDPSPYVDTDGRAYLLWKSEGLGGAAAPTLWSQELTADGLGLTGPARPLISVDRSFERGVVEGPSMLRDGDRYFLVYAAGDWNAGAYATAYASCTAPTGPCTKPDDGRVLRSGPQLAGPGGAEVFRDRDGALWAVFHAFSEPNVGYPSSRYMHIARLRVVDGRIVIDAST
jgi:hypothetical protein